MLAAVERLVAAGEALRVRDEAVVAAVRAEVVVVSRVLRPRRSHRRLDLHSTDRIDGVAFTAAEARAVLVEPEDAGERGQEGEVQEGRVIPVEGRLDDHQRALPWDEAGAAEEVLSDQPGDRHHSPHQRHQPQR